MSRKNKRNNQSSRHLDSPQHQEQQPHNEPGHWDTEQVQEHSRQQAMAAREKATRDQLSAGQTKVQRLHRGNQPRGGR